MTTYVLIDAANTFFRSRHVTRGDISEKVGMSLHVMFSSLRKAWLDFDGSHVVFCFEGRSWRKNVYAPYKRNRQEARGAMTVKEVEEDKAFWEVFESFKEYIETKTNCTVLQNSTLEADDLIAGWIKKHPSDDHVIISTDKDFAQLISENVKQYNGVSGTTITLSGYFDDKGGLVKDNKTGKIKEPPDPEWLLFEKCIRGDTSDNVFSAYPGVRTKGTKNRVGLVEAFEDRKDKGWAWNNLMLQRWTDHEGVEHRVIDDYNRNVLLCDLTAQPDDIKKEIDGTIDRAITANKQIPQVGVWFMKFCGKHDLQRVSEQSSSFINILNTRYKNDN